MVKRFIWDLDGTILDGDFAREEKLFKENLSEEDYTKFISKWFNLLGAYERKHRRYKCRY